MQYFPELLLNFLHCLAQLPMHNWTFFNADFYPFLQYLPTVHQVNNLQLDKGDQQMSCGYWLAFYLVKFQSLRFQNKIFDVLIVHEDKLRDFPMKLKFFFVKLYPLNWNLVVQFKIMMQKFHHFFCGRGQPILFIVQSHKTVIDFESGRIYGFIVGGRVTRIRQLSFQQQTRRQHLLLFSFFLLHKCSSTYDIPNAFIDIITDFDGLPVVILQFLLEFFGNDRLVHIFVCRFDDFRFEIENFGNPFSFVLLFVLIEVFILVNDDVIVAFYQRVIFTEGFKLRLASFTNVYQLFHFFGLKFLILIVFTSRFVSRFGGIFLVVISFGFND